MGFVKGRITRKYVKGLRLRQASACWTYAYESVPVQTRKRKAAKKR